ncbi:MAG: hypothetical protein WBE75_05175 [Candidatus Omnitrophota bacterium]|jgi:hypothetical protein
MRKGILLTLTAAFIVLAGENFVRAADDTPSIVSTDMKMVIKVENVYNNYGVQINGTETTTTTTTTTNSKDETSTTITTQTVTSEWRGGSIKVAKIEGTSNTDGTDDSSSATTFTITYEYADGTGKLKGASGTSSTTGDSGTDDNGEAIGTYKTSTTDSYTIRNGQALRTKSETTGESYGSDGTKKGDITQTSTTEYELVAGTWQVSKETTVSKNTGVDGSSESITRIKTYTRDDNGVITGVSQTATGTRVAITSAGGTVTLGMTDYTATFTFDEESGWYLEKESYTWEQGASGEESSDDSSDTE